MLSLYFPAALWGWPSDPILQIRNSRLGDVSLLASFTQLLCWDLAFGILTLNSKLHCPWSVAGETGWTHMHFHMQNSFPTSELWKGLWKKGCGNTGVEDMNSHLGNWRVRGRTLVSFIGLLWGCIETRWKMLSTVHTRSGCAASVLL